MLQSHSNEISTVLAQCRQCDGTENPDTFDKDSKKLYIREKAGSSANGTEENWPYLNIKE